MKALVADRDVSVVAQISVVLQRSGYQMMRAQNGPDALRLWESDPSGVVVADTQLPRLNGFELCRRLRLQYNAPTILMSTSREEEDMLRAFEVGADDYVVKPVSAEQLLARVDALRRRYAISRQEHINSRAEVQGLVMDGETRETLLDGVSLPLTPTEFQLLYILALNPRRVIPFARLTEYLWGNKDLGIPSSLGVHVSHIRKKLARPGDSKLTIELVRGIGYSLVSR